MEKEDDWVDPMDPSSSPTDVDEAPPSEDENTRVEPPSGIVVTGTHRDSDPQPEPEPVPLPGSDSDSDSDYESEGSDRKVATDSVPTSNSPPQQGTSDFEAVLRRKGRSGPDIITRIPGWLTGIALGLFCGAMMLGDSARPGFRHTGWAAMFGRRATTYWKTDTLETAFYLMLACFACCTLGLLFKSRRVRRADDRIDMVAITLSLLGASSAVAVVWYWIRFG